MQRRKTEHLQRRFLVKRERPHPAQLALRGDQSIRRFRERKAGTRRYLDAISHAETALRKTSFDGSRMDAAAGVESELPPASHKNVHVSRSSLTGGAEPDGVRSGW